MSKKENNKKIRVNNIEILFTSKKVTAFGGFSLLAAFFEKIGLKSFLEKAFPIKENSPNSIGAYAKLLGFLLTVLAGGKRFAHLLYLGEGKDILAPLFGVRKIPQASSTLTRFFRKIKSWVNLKRFQEVVWGYLLTLIPWRKIKEDDLNFDSHVVVRYGTQERAKKGYNRKKPGRPSHHPLLAFLNRSRYVVNLRNRPGNAPTSKDIVAFAKQTFQRLQDKIKITGVFADPGFYHIDFITFLEEQGLPYVIAAPLYIIFQHRFISKEFKWHEVFAGVEMAEFFFQHLHGDWKKSRRYFAIREKIRDDKEVLGKQLSLFPELEVVKNYRYRLYITNREDEIKQLWDFYRKRSDDENRIKELVEDFGIDGFSLKPFYATEAAMLMNCFLYNLINLFRSEILSRKESSERASTLRYKYWTIPGIGGRRGNQLILRLSTRSKRLKAKITYLFSRIISGFFEYGVQLQCS